MNLSTRKRFILYVVCGYLVFGSTWIFLSDRLLLSFTDISAITGLSTAKGIAFILLTALLLILALSAIPDRETAELQGRYRTSQFLIRADQLPRWIAYVFAAAVTLAMLFVRMRIPVSFGERSMIILFMLPIILSSVLGGFGPGLIATAVASLGVDYFVIPPLYSLRIKESHDLFQWFMLITIGILSSYLSEMLHRARRQSEERRVLQEIAQDELIRSEARFSTIFHASPMGIDLVKMKDGRITHANDAFLQMLGYSREELIGRTSLELGLYVDPDDRKRLVGQVRERQRVMDFETRFRRKSGETGTLLLYVEPIELWEEQFFLSIAVDITRRKLAEEALKQSELRFRNVARLSSDFAYSCCHTGDGEYVVDWITDTFYTLTGISKAELRDLRCWMVLAHPEDRDMATEPLHRLQPGDCDTREFRIVAIDGRILTITNHMECETDPAVPGGLRIYGSVQDITDRRKAEEEKAKLETQLQQAQKFEAIGTLAGGIAHDFNNLLMGIQGHASLLSLDLETFHPHWEHIQAIEEYIRSATNLTKQLLGFARGGKYEVKSIDMNELVLGSSAMFGRTKKEIQIHTKCQTSSLVVEVDRGQIEQVLLNMYVNSWQAMPPGGGELYLETKIVTLDEGYCKSHQVDPGRYVKVSITDTGAGMDEATRLRIFDPFFTTKEKSRGTGLGLASAYGIIKNHGGMVTVYSEIGHGATFNIYLPVSDKEVYREVPMGAGLIKGSATILLVDDEEMIIDVGRAMLERLGYRVVVSRGGREAVKAITDMGNEIDMVILDLIMPGMDGGTTFDRIREIQPGMPVLLSSGYAINGRAHEIMRRGCNGFIQKPYNISDLSNKVCNVLDGKNG